MGQRTSIEWTEVTWNPTTGCTKVSAGCDNCYAEALSRRLLSRIYRRRLPVAVAARVPFFFKQWGGRTPKAGGRLLDGREWSEFPGWGGAADRENRNAGEVSA
ncbi:MAG: DUF5131 family protein [Gemmatimonadetes bacterium]|nr:DUF5131 family protein [Gemmatimonadota bacterium]MYG22249.1 DUF5131 family protein [Gemmatimonadota bacterium]MYJ39093.1 DUF5131 family protein [Gemmatimonadota bacterium]